MQVLVMGSPRVRPDEPITCEAFDEIITNIQRDFELIKYIQSYPDCNLTVGIIDKYFREDNQNFLVEIDLLADQFNINREKMKLFENDLRLYLLRDQF